MTSLSPVHPLGEAEVVELLDECVRSVGGDVALHSCAPGLPWKLLQRSMIKAVSIDAHTLTAADLDGVGEFLESGRTVLLGAVPATLPAGRASATQIAATAAGLTDRLGLGRQVLQQQVGVTPACGLAGATTEWARTAIELAQRAADGIAENPDMCLDAGAANP